MKRRVISPGMARPSLALGVACIGCWCLANGNANVRRFCSDPLDLCNRLGEHSALSDQQEGFQTFAFQCIMNDSVQIFCRQALDPVGATDVVHVSVTVSGSKDR